MYLAWKEQFDSHEIENALKNSVSSRTERTSLGTKGKIKEERCVFPDGRKIMWFCLKNSEYRTIFADLDV